MIEDILNKHGLVGRQKLKKFRYFLFSIKTEITEERKIDYKSSAIIFTKAEGNKIKKQIESMEHFDEWENFGDTWDVLWAGLYVTIDERTRKPKEVFWRPGFFGSDRKLVEPVSLVVKNKVGRMETTFDDTRRLFQVEVPHHLKAAMMEMRKDVMEDQMIGEVLPGGEGFAAAEKEKMRMEDEERKRRELLSQQRAIAEQLSKIENKKD